MSSQSRIAELSAVVAAHTHLIDTYLAENALPYPSFEADGPTELGLPAELEESRALVLQATQELNDLLQTPRDLLYNHHHNRLLYMKAIYRFDIAHQVPLDGEITYRDLAAIVGVDSAALSRILRLGIAYRIFREPHPGVIAHSPASRSIAEDSGISDWMGANTHELWPAAEKTVEALIKWPGATEPNQAGFSLAKGTNDPYLKELSKDPEKARRFGGAMSFFISGPKFSPNHLTDNYPWATLNSVVDVGGSHGDMAFALARKYPNLHITVQDLPTVVASAKKENGLNVQFMGHDFFEEQPIKNADVYLYRWVLHDWPDKYCVKILRALIPALKHGARVIVMEAVLPPFGVIPNDMERNLRAMDISMLELSNAKERDLDEWKTLFQEADPRFIFQGVKQPSGSNLAIIELAWEG
ncbi:putative O-methyltransferase [Hypoxylon trugodes]|uniref:putative O-methyltransferase n=1 Tax=Hypoxylon trugodes TaxID=326681 RepID=UPI00219179E8|nr:putative O-methyltransferase [Hypoxylon trugodes]KAI1385143.1 putative O-methyltransferase [Hypoxylon trugodes]